MRAAFIILSFLVTTAIFSCVAREDAEERLARLEQVSAPISAPRPATQDPAGPPGVPVTVMTIEGQPYTWPDAPYPLAEQLQQQAELLRSGADVVAVDENLVTEYQQHGDSTPYPSQRNDTLDARGSLFVEQADKDVSVVRRWDANTGNMETVLLLQGVDVSRCLDTAISMWCLVRPNGSPDPRTDHIVYVARDGSNAVTPLTVTRNDPYFASLPDNTVLIVGGTANHSGSQLNTVEHVRMHGTQLGVEALSEIPGPPRWGRAPVVLRDGRLLVAGGNSEQRRGCKSPDCTDTSYVLDANTGQWTAGPTLEQPRASATASLLSDGSIIVAGGWTSDRAGNARPLRSTERLWPGEAQFIADAPLPFAMAEHRTLAPLNDAAASALLLDEGGKSVVAYDLAQSEWRLVGGFSTFTSFKLGPFSNGKEHYFWVADAREDEWSRQVIRVRGYQSPSTISHAATVHIHRSAAGIVAGDTALPAIIAGGSVSSPYRLTTAVDSYSDAQGLQALSPLASPRYDAAVFRLADGAVAVAGGITTGRESREPEQHTPPIEVLRTVSTREKWRTLGIEHPRGTYYAQLADNALVAFSPSGDVERIDIVTADDDELRIERERLPKLPVERESGTQAGEKVVARGLADGRLIVAGGRTYEKRIAIYQEAPDAVEEYVGIGEQTLARTYEIYDPEFRRWHTSSRSSEPGGQVVLMDDGRVVKLRIKSASLREEGEPDFTFLFELSHANDGDWQPLPMYAPPYMEAGSTRLLTVSNELFVAGYSEASFGMERKRVLWWLDGERQAWETVWEERDSSLDSRHQDVLARVKLSTGRELLVPVGGN